MAIKNRVCYTLFNIILHILAGYFLCLLRLTRDLETQKEVQHLCGESNELLRCRALYCRCRVRTNEADPAAFGGNMKLAVNSIRNLVSQAAAVTGQLPPFLAELQFQ